MEKLISGFFKADYISYASYEGYRKIASFIDGQKPTARKVIYTFLKKNITTPLKISRACSVVAEATAYLHGEQSIYGVAVGLAQDFVGANNIPLLKREGSFGTRAIQVAAAGRYICTCVEPYLDNLFIKDDFPILIEQEFEGDIIEPRFYVPIIPLLLVNGNEGLSVGFAQKIFPRNPKDLIHYIKLKLTGHKMNNSKLLPFYKGYDGTVVELEPGSFAIKGKFTRTKKDTIEITEVPVGYDLRKYLDELDGFEEKQYIQSYKDMSTDSKFKFEVRLAKDWRELSDEELLDKLKLIKRATENYTCTDENNKIVEFKSVEEILESYMKIRLEYYAKRKGYLINKLKLELRITISKYLFVKCILDDKIIVNNKNYDQIVKQIEKVKDICKIEDSYNYLLNMKIYNLSQEKIKELKQEISDLNNKLKTVEKKKIEEMWTEDLEALNKVLN